MTLDSLQKMSIVLTGKTVPFVHGINLYVEQMREALKKPANTLGQSFDNGFYL